MNTSKYKIGDTVWTIIENKIHEFIVLGIIVGEDVHLRQFNISEKKMDAGFLNYYYQVKYIDNKYLEKDSSIHMSCFLDEYHIFATKEELIASL